MRFFFSTIGNSILGNENLHKKIMKNTKLHPWPLDVTSLFSTWSITARRENENLLLD
jgi:hypothetical protein